MKMMNDKYDVVIAGGGTAGCACAYIAAKLGLKVLLVEKNSYLGGSITSSLVIPAMKTSENAINNDFFNSLYENLHNIGGAITYCDGNKGWFNPELTKIVLDKMLYDAGVDILFESYINHAEFKEKMLSLCIESIYNDNTTVKTGEKLSLYIDSIHLVDGTGDGKICEKLNCEFLDNKNKNQPVSLRFIMSGVDSNKFAKWITKYDKDRNVTTVYTIDDDMYCSTAYTWDTGVKWALKPLFEDAIKKNVLTETDSNYFQLFTVAGTSGNSIAFNAPRLIEPRKTRTEAYIKGRASIFRISDFCKKYLKGFEKAYISSISPELGVRTSRQVKGQYIYTINDLKNGKKFEHPVVVSNYPVDIHSDKKDSSKLDKVMKEYQLPLESLIVKDNLYVIGKCISADFESIGALRIIPSCFSMGEGLAKYLREITK